MRGKRKQNPTVQEVVGITPAHAGKTSNETWLRKLSRDHPRACGENFIRHFLAKILPGSPPRMRGKHSESTGRLCGARITPAHAGKTITKRASPLGCQDHPRACGENEIAGGNVRKGEGSPPRMRGKHHIAIYLELKNRITPAHAGKTRLTLICPAVDQDHPRACGENTTRKAVRGKCPGSPPRMRGKLTAFSLAPVRAGITPAHAGKTWSCNFFNLQP